MQEQKKIDGLLKNFIRGSFIIFFGLFLSKILTYLYRIIIARNLGQEMYGLFSLSIMVVGFFAAFFSLGLQEGILRYLSFYLGKKDPEKVKSLYKFAINITFFSAIIAGLILFFSSEFISVNIFHNVSLIFFLKLFAIFLPIFIFAGLFHVLLRIYEKMSFYTFIGNILAPSIQLISLIILIYLGFKSGAVIFSYSLGSIIILIASFLIAKYTFSHLFSNHTKNIPSLNKELISYSWPIMFLGIVVSLFSWIDSFTIGFFKSVSDVGIYNVAIPLAFLLDLVPSLFLQFFLPVIMKEYSNNNLDIIKTLTKQIEKWICILNIPILIILIFFPGAVINIIFGSEYLAAADSLRFLAIGGFFYSTFKISENLLSMVGKSKIVLFNILVSAILNITLNILLIPRYGINGAAFATMISYIFWSGLSFFIAKKYTSINPLKSDLFKVLLVAIISSSLLFYIRGIVPINMVSLILVGILFFSSYLILIFFVKAFDKNDLMILRTIKKRFFK